MAGVRKCCRDHLGLSKAEGVDAGPLIEALGDPYWQVRLKAVRVWDSSTHNGSCGSHCGEPATS